MNGRLAKRRAWRLPVWWDTCAPEPAALTAAAETTWRATVVEVVSNLALPSALEPEGGESGAATDA